MRRQDHYCCPDVLETATAAHPVVDPAHPSGGRLAHSRPDETVADRRGGHLAALLGEIGPAVKDHPGAAEISAHLAADRRQDVALPAQCPSDAARQAHFALADAAALQDEDPPELCRPDAVHLEAQRERRLVARQQALAPVGCCLAGLLRVVLLPDELPVQENAKLVEAKRAMIRRTGSPAGAARPVLPAARRQREAQQRVQRRVAARQLPAAAWPAFSRRLSPTSQPYLYPLRPVPPRSRARGSACAPLRRASCQWSSSASSFP